MAVKQKNHYLHRGISNSTNFNNIKNRKALICLKSVATIASPYYP